MATHLDLLVRVTHRGDEHVEKCYQRRGVVECELTSIRNGIFTPNCWYELLIMAISMLRNTIMDEAW